MTEKKTSLLGYIIPFLLGVLAFYLTQKIQLFVNRPIIESNLKSINIHEVNKNDWRILLKYNFINIGESNTTLHINNIKLFFPEYSNRSIEIETDKYVKLNGNSSIQDSLVARFPTIFDSVMIDHIPRLNNIVFEFQTIENNRKHIIEQDSSDVIYSYMYSLEYHGLEKIKSAVVDSLNEKLTIPTKKCYIEYKGRKYINTFFPRDAIVKYRTTPRKVDTSCS